MRGVAVTSSCSSLTAMAQRAAQETVHEMSSRLVSGSMGILCASEICGKVGSIVRKEVVPLLIPGSASRDQEHLMQLAGRILGVAYLADYALENRLGFKVDDAAECVLTTVRTIGVDERFAHDEIKRLQDLYCYECNYLTNRRKDRLAETRYLLKSSDVVFAQLLVLHVSAEGARSSEERALRCAGAALDVYDDLVDRDEDAGFAANPFAGIGDGSSGQLLGLFHKLATPFMKSINEFAATAPDGVVGRYCGHVLSRLEPLFGVPT